MAKHAPGFLKLVNEARKWIVETTVQEVKARMDRGEPITLIDVREDSEFAVDHLPGAIHRGDAILVAHLRSYDIVPTLPCISSMQQNENGRN